MAKRSPKNKTKIIEPNSKKTNATAAHQPDIVILVLAGLGMAITAYLTGVAWLNAAPAFCGAGSNCDVIQQSRWSTVLGLPLALWGFLVYGVIALMAYRTVASNKRWSRIWWVSLVGLVFSLYLTWVGIAALDAVCLWCLASLTVMAAIFIANALRRVPKVPELPWWNWLLNSGIVALLAVAALHLYYNSDLLRAPEDPRLAPLAAHLTKSGAKFYGASWCTSCQRQKKIFGDQASALPYVECSPYGQGGIMAAECTRAGVANFPTWIIAGKSLVGVLEPEDLARISGFNWQTPSDE